MKKVIASLMTLLILATGIIFLVPTSKVNASTATENFVARLYQTCMGRNGDASGISYWANKLDNKTATGASVAANFIFSPEFKNANYSNDQFLTKMYKAFFDRNPDAGGKAYYLNQLAAGKTRAEVFKAFVNSTEFARICSDYGILRGEFIVGQDYNRVAQINCFVDRLYRVVLGRGSDQAGLSYWTTKLLNGSATGSTCAASFFFSDEYKAKNKSNDAFLEDLYQAMMGRAGDASGKAYYNKIFSWEHSKAYVFNQFVSSQEFARICASYGITPGSGVLLAEIDYHVVNTDATYNGRRVYQYQVDGYGTVYGYFVDTTEFNSLVARYRSTIGLSTTFSSSSYIRTRAIECTIVFGHTRPNGQQWHQSPDSAYLSEILTQRANNRDAYDSFIASPTHKHIIEYYYPDFTTAAFVRVNLVNGQWQLVAESLVAHSRP